MFVERLTARADVVSRCLASSESEPIGEQSLQIEVEELPRCFLDFGRSRSYPDENADIKVDGKGEQGVDEAAVTRSRGGYTVKNKPEGLYGKFRQCSKYNRRLCLQLHGSIQL